MRNALKPPCPDCCLILVTQTAGTDRLPEQEMDLFGLKDAAFILHDHANCEYIQNFGNTRLKNTYYPLTSCLNMIISIILAIISHYPAIINTLFCIIILHLLDHQGNSSPPR